MKDTVQVETQIIRQIKMLSAEAIQKANSGHPGLPLGAAHIGVTLFHHFLKLSPQNPTWINRDRFILSPGHGSMLLYSLLHLYGYDISLDDIKNFRQLGSKTAGHPEYNLDLGIEMTTGPLGQGAATSVGMALAERYLRNKFSKDIINHKTVALVSDGDLMEGISYEAASVAGHQPLSNLYWIYDSNQISIEGSTETSFTENIQKRFESCGWKVLTTDEPTVLSLRKELDKAARTKNKPKLIIVNTIIGDGAFEKEGTAGSHGAPLGKDIIKKMKQAYDYKPNKAFYRDTEIDEELNKKQQEFLVEFEKWNKKLEQLKKSQPDLVENFQSWCKGEIDNSWIKDMKKIDTPEATRGSSGKVVNALADKIPHLMITSADLTPSTKVVIKEEVSMQPKEPLGRNIQLGIREHAMGAIANGMALHSHFIPLTSTFLVFSDYMRYSVRLASLMKTPTIFVFSHDSFYVGEDGPTHQPVEHLDSLRLIPDLTVYRPADLNETIASFQSALSAKGPSAIITSRQSLPQLKESKIDADLGGYLAAGSLDSDLVFYATGSEVSICVEAIAKLAKKGIKAGVISLPSIDLFLARPLEEQSSLLPKSALKIGVEAGTGLFLKTFTDKVFCLPHFAQRAPSDQLAKKYGFTAHHLAEFAHAKYQESKE